MIRRRWDHGTSVTSAPSSPAGGRAPQDNTDPTAPGVPRRRFLRDAGAVAAAAPFIGALLDALAVPGASAGTPLRKPKFPTENPWPKYAAYRFALICHLTEDPFFVPCRLGAKDASALLGTSFTWNGSASGDVTEMVDAFEEALDNEVNGIGLCVVDPKAFNGLIDQALASGIPVVAFNAEAPPGTGNNALSYVGQDHFAAGAALAERAVKHVEKGQTVAAMIGAPSSRTEQSRLNGAASVFERVGAHMARVTIGTHVQSAARNIEDWYGSHPGVRFIFTTAGYNGEALANASAKLAWTSKGVQAAAFDISQPVLKGVSRGTLAFTIDEQAYLQGFLPIFQLFIYNISGGLILPFDADTGHKFVTRENVGAYLLQRDTWEGSSTTPVVLTPPHKIRLV
jgi:simple sugar transport system substrate-binding protein